MNNAQHREPFDAAPKSREPFARVDVIYSPDLQRNTAAPPTAAESSIRHPKPRRAIARKPSHARANAHESSLERHQRKCVVCSHPDRETIEELFLHWHSPLATALHYHLPVRSLFRHAHATGLYASRQGNLRAVLDRILDRAEEATVTADSIVRALRAYTCLTAGNQWIEPPSRVIFSTVPHTAPADPAPLVPSATNSRNPGASQLALVDPQDESPVSNHQPLTSGTLIDTPAIRK